MSKITFVVGASGVGKSTFIENYKGKNRTCQVLDIPALWKNKYGNYDLLVKGDEMDLELYMEISDLAFFAIINNEELVVEYNANGQDEGLADVISLAKKLGINTEIMFLDLDANEAFQRVQKSGSDYFPSYSIKEMTEDILICTLYSIEENMGLTEIFSVISEALDISFFKKSEEGNESYFYISAPKGGLIPEDLGNDYGSLSSKTEYLGFEEAFDQLQKQHSVFNCELINVDDKYKEKMKLLFDEFFAEQVHNGFANQSWLNL